MHSGVYDDLAGESGSLTLPQEELPADLYELLQVSPRASLVVIQAAYRVLARTYHPDVNDGSETVRQMRQLNAAYDVLSDPRRRARYDAQFAPPTRQSAGKPRPRVIHTRTARPQLALGTERHSGLQLFARALVVALLVAMVIGALLLAWLIIVEPDDRPASGFRPRAAGPEISAPSASHTRSSGLCGLFRQDPFSC
jgi:curved DNA-binding protein CbpA